MLIGIPIVGLMVNAILFGQLLEEGKFTIFSKCQILATGYTALYWFVFREIHFFFIRKYPGYQLLMKRFMVMIPTLILSFIFVKLVMVFTIDKAFHEWLAKDNIPHELTEIISSFLLLTLIITIYESKYLAHQLRLSQLEKEQLVKENISSQLEGLRNQVNPHFLFNSLNTLSSIISEDQEKAIRFVSKMSKVYRYILEIKDKKVVSLREEFDFLESYTFLLKERFGENIQISINIPEAQMDNYIVPLSLQILFENAIKHNVISKMHPLVLEVYVNEEQKLVVKNNFQKKNVIETSTKVGLQNIKNRYRFFTDTPVEIISTLQHFIVMLPLLKNNGYD